MPPCLTPVSTLKGSATWLLCMTRHSKFSYKAWMMLTNLCGKTLYRRTFQSDGRRRLSRAFSKSTNTTYKALLHSCDCSRIWQRTKMWSKHDFPILMPACSLRSSLSSAVVMRCRMMRQKTSLVMDSSVMPLLLLNSDRFPFFLSLIIVPLFQASGIASLSQTSWRMCRRSCGITCSYDFSISACTLSSIGVLAFISYLAASFTAWTVMGPISMSRSCSASQMSASVGGSIQLKSC